MTLRMRGLRALPSAIGVSLLTVILAMQVSAAAETEHMFLQFDPSMSRAEQELQALTPLVPAGARVLMYDPKPRPARGAWTSNTRLLAVASYFLAESDQTFTVDPYADSFNPLAGRQLSREDERRFPYIVMPANQGAPPPMPPDFRLRWAGRETAIRLYERAGAGA